MTRSVENDRSTEPANRDAQNISAENVVNSIHAEGAAKVIIRQISYHWLSEVEEERTRQKAELDLLQKAIANKYLELNRLVGTPAPAVGNPFLFLQPFGFTDAARFFGRGRRSHFPRARRFMSLPGRRLMPNRMTITRPSRAIPARPSHRHPGRRRIRLSWFRQC